jgi:hypothetical protein
VSVEICVMEEIEPSKMSWTFTVNVDRAGALHLPFTMHRSHASTLHLSPGVSTVCTALATHLFFAAIASHRHAMITTTPLEIATPTHPSARMQFRTDQQFQASYDENSSRPTNRIAISTRPNQRMAASPASVDHVSKWRDDERYRDIGRVEHSNHTQDRPGSRKQPEGEK